MSYPTTALIADDEQHLRLFLKLVLQKLGFETIYEAPNGQKAVEIYKESKPGFVLLDINMPIMNGLDALSKIVETNPDAVVVIMTSVASRQFIEQSAALGAAFYIRKDTPKDDLIAALKEALDEHFGN